MNVLMFALLGGIFAGFTAMLRSLDNASLPNIPAQVRSRALRQYLLGVMGAILCTVALAFVL